MLRRSSPQLRTAHQILAKNEEILDALEHQRITPKAAEQLGQCCKVPMALARLELSFRRFIKESGKTAPVPRSPLLRTVIGLPEGATPEDGAAVRELLPKS